MSGRIKTQADASGKGAEKNGLSNLSEPPSRRYVFAVTYTSESDHAPSVAKSLARPSGWSAPARLLRDLSRTRSGGWMEAPVRRILDLGLARLQEGGDAHGVDHRG